MHENVSHGTYSFDKDTRRYHRFQVETEDGFKGTIYLPKELNDGLPKEIVLKYRGKDENAEDDYDEDCESAT